MYILKENGRKWGEAHTKFEAENAKRDREKFAEIVGKNQMQLFLVNLLKKYCNLH